MISVNFSGIDELILRLDLLPQNLRAILRSKFENIFAELTTQFFEGEGRFLDPNQVQTGITEQGSMLIGYIEYGEKEGFYSIYPVNKPMLYNLKQQFFAREVHFHPYPKGAPVIEQVLRDSKPWVLEELESAAREIGELF
jgi:hypothetical protein